MNPRSHSNFGMAFCFAQKKAIPMHRDGLKIFLKNHITFHRKWAYHYRLMKTQ